MGIPRTINSIVQYIYEATARIFGPNDDAYPATGIQPFAGEPFKQRQRRNW